MNLTKRIISSALVLSMATLTIPVEAYATSNTIKGQVLAFFSVVAYSLRMVLRLLV